MEDPSLGQPVKPSRERLWLWSGLVLLGTVVRFWFGCSKTLWNAAPDQLAWDLSLDDLVHHGAWSYRQLIHYPHEGGSLLLSLLALVFRPLAGIMPPLSWAALVTDALSRYVQISVAHRLFGARIASWFGVWTVLSIPLLLPWATVDFSLHALVAFLPFLLIRYATDPRISPLKLGLLCGLGASLAYDCWVFAPAFLIWALALRWRGGEALRNTVSFLLGCLLAFLPHIGLRLFVDDGFDLEQMPAFGVRGLEQEPVQLGGVFTRLITTWHTTLPASFMLSVVKAMSPLLLCLAVLTFMLVGIIAALLGRVDRTGVPALMLLIVLGFTVAYAAGPLFIDRLDSPSYVVYRHFSFILPLLVLLMIKGFASLCRAAPYAQGAWLATSGIIAVLYMTGFQPCTRPNHEAAGWVLARKYGHEPEHLMRILALAPAEARQDLLLGYGWGTTTTVFERRTAADEEALKRLDALWVVAAPADRARMLEGVKRAFAPGITPVLEASIGPVVMDRLSPRTPGS